MGTSSDNSGWTENSWSDEESYHFLPRAFRDVEIVNRPQPHQLEHDTSYPHLSSTAFRYKIYNSIKEPRDFLPFYSLIEMSSLGLFVIATNDFASPIVDGNLIGAENFDSIVRHNIRRTVFQLPGHNTVCGLKFLEPNLFVTTKMDNSLELYSTKHPIRDEKNYNVFRISEQRTDGYALNIAKMSQESKLIAGTVYGNLSVFDYGSTDITCIDEILHAHNREITGVSSHPSSTKIWATCALDCSCLLWDKSKEKPASAILSNYEHGLTAMHWTTQEENQELLVLGDEIGNVLTVDPRMPNKILNTTRVSDRPISKLSFNGSKRLGVISESNVMKIVEATNGSEPMKLVHKHSSPGTLYAMCWDCMDKEVFYVVGENKFALKINLTQIA